MGNLNVLIEADIVIMHYVDYTKIQAMTWSLTNSGDIKPNE